MLDFFAIRFYTDIVIYFVVPWYAIMIKSNIYTLYSRCPNSFHFRTRFWDT